MQLGGIVTNVLGASHPVYNPNMPGMVLNPLELTGRATTHVVAVDDPRCTLHRDVVEPFRDLRAAAAHEGVDLQPVSTFRDFDRQLAIWNAKCRGERELLDHHGAPIAAAGLSEDDLISVILVWSALPGASRHHWGTEIDVIDAAALPAGARARLVPEDYVAGGVFERLGAFLQRNLHDHGFYRPYAVDRGGVQPEPWHLSHVASAGAAQAAFTPAVLREALEGAPLEAAPTVLERLPEIFERYVANVEPPPVGQRVA